MQNKRKRILSGILVAICFLCFGIGIGIFFIPSHNSSSTFLLQEEYEKKLERKLIDLLEPATGIGNIRASIQAEIKHPRIIKKQIYPQAQVTIQENDPVLVEQSVSVLINGANRSRLSAYERLIKSAINFNNSRGDKLTVEILPFVPIPFWSFGLSPICLIHIGAILFLFFLIGFCWLCVEWINTFSKRTYRQPYILNDNLWEEVKNIPIDKLGDLLKTNRPEITACILFHLSQEKAASVIESLPPDYVNQVILHLDHIEKLSVYERAILLQETENCLAQIIKAFQWNSKNAESDSIFDKLKNWENPELQNLLRYVSKHDLVDALQITSKEIQEKFKKNIPPDLWEKLIQQMQSVHCSKEESKLAQKKIMHIAELLKEKQDALY